MRAGGDAKSGDYTPEPFDWYVEDPWCTDLLLSAETFEGSILDPACGAGTIVERAIAHGYLAGGADIVDRNRIADFPFERRCFLETLGTPAGMLADNILSNPPYSYERDIAEAFIWRALEVTRRKVAMLVPNKFMGSQGRHPLFTGTPLKKVYWLSSRPSMPPGSMLEAGTIKRGGGKVDYCWMVWERGFNGASTNHYLIRPEHLAKPRKAKRTGAADG